MQMKENHHWSIGLNSGVIMRSRGLWLGDSSCDMDRWGDMKGQIWEMKPTFLSRTILIDSIKVLTCELWMAMNTLITWVHGINNHWLYWWWNVDGFGWSNKERKMLWCPLPSRECSNQDSYICVPNGKPGPTSPLSGLMIIQAPFLMEWPPVI